MPVTTTTTNNSNSTTKKGNNMASVFSPMSRTAVNGCRAITSDRSTGNSSPAKNSTATMLMSNSDASNVGSSGGNGRMAENTTTTNKAQSKFALPKIEQNGFRHFREWASLAP